MPDVPGKVVITDVSTNPTHAVTGVDTISTHSVTIGDIAHG
jgi:hypothetical protein